jgi:hypothetical protein
VSSQDFVDQGLISDAAATCFLAELIEHSWIDANRDQLARLVAKTRTAHASHGLQLLRGRRATEEVLGNGGYDASTAREPSG